MSTLTTRRMTVEEYRLTHEDDRTELIEGVVVEKMTKNRAHSIGATNSRQAIEGVLPPGWHAGAETPVLLPGVVTLKEPDVSVIRGAANDYAEIDPGPPDVALIAEVSDTSVAKDRALAFTYHAAGVPTYWLVNVRDRQLEVYTTDPSTPVVIAEDGHAELVLDGRVVARIAVADLLPRL